MVMIYILFSPHRLQLADAEGKRGRSPFSQPVSSISGRLAERKKVTVPFFQSRPV
jgi:hypothetical protein